MRAELHLEWGLDLAEHGELGAAETELRTSAKMAPESRDAAQALDRTARYRRERAERKAGE